MFLLTLLPLAGWAATDLTDKVNVDVTNFEFGTKEAFEAGVDVIVTRNDDAQGAVVATANYDIVGIYPLKEGVETYASEADLDLENGIAITEVNAADYLNDLNAGKYCVKVEFKGAFEGSAYGEFGVTPVKIVVTVMDDNFFKKNFLQDLPRINQVAIDDFMGVEGSDFADVVSATINGVEVDADELADYLAVTPDPDEGAEVADPFLEYSYDTDNENLLFFPGINVIEEKAGNYVIEFAQHLVIEKITIDDADPFAFVAEIPADGFTYNGQNQAPEFTITYDEAYQLEPDLDYTVVITKNGDEPEVVEEAINAGEYTVTVYGAGSYFTTNPGGLDEDPGVEIGEFNFTINKENLYVVATPVTKEFDGEGFEVDDDDNLVGFKYGLVGLVEADQALFETIVGITGSIDGDNNGNVGEYEITVDADGATIGEGDDAIELTTNYEVDATEKGIWTITAKDLYITIAGTMTAGADAVYPIENGAPEDALTITLTDKDGQEVEDDILKEAIAEALVMATGDGEVLDEYENASDVPAGEYENAIILTIAQVEALANYNVNPVAEEEGDEEEGEEEVEEVDADHVYGTLTVKGKDFKVMPVVATTIEYGDEIEITFRGLSNATFNEEAIAYQIIDNAAEDEEAAVVFDSTDEDADLSTLVLPLGNYTVNIDETTIEGTGDNNLGEGEALAAAFSIVKKVLTVEVADQTVNVGADAEAFLAGLGDGDYEITDGDLVGEETISVAFAFDEAAEVDLSEAGEFANVITVTLPEGEANNDNYDFNVVVKGTLTVGGEGTALVLQESEDLLDNIAAAAANGGTCDVTLKGRTLKANTWNVLVLPFEIQTIKFCQSIGGYAAFNVLTDITEPQVADIDNVTEIKFGLELDRIPANQPFLVKPLATAGDTEDGITFEDVEVENAVPTQELENGSFIGTYEEMVIDSDDYWAVQGGAFKHFSVSNILGFTRAYIQLKGAAEQVRFYIEEGDGTTTVINGLTGDEMNVKADGWYTINGMKLESIPTEKGVYINNGKKVVIK